MKKQHYILALLFLALMVGILIYQRGSQKVYTDFSKSSRISIKDFSDGDLTAIKCYWGEKKDDGVFLKKENDKWVVSSYYSAPADTGKIKRVIEQVVKISGDLRASDPGVFSDFRLGDKEAVHLALYGDSGKELVHVLIGKRAPGYGRSFVRFSGKNDVYLADNDYRYLVGLYGDKNENPKSRGWADLQFAKVDTAAVKKLVLLEDGKKKLVLERSETKQEVEKPEKKKAEKKAEKQTKPFVKVISWERRFPREGKKPDKREVDAIIGALSRLRATDIMDPEKSGDLTEYGLKRPKYTVSIHSDKGEPLKLLLGKKDKNYYAKPEGGSHVYKINQRGYDQSVVKLAALAEKPQKVKSRKKPARKKKKTTHKSSKKKTRKTKQAKPPPPKSSKSKK